MEMAKNSRATTLPVLDPALGERIRHVVDMFDRKKDAAEVAGVIPEQLNRWCQAQSEPRFVGVARLASAQAVRLEWIVTGKGPVHIDPATDPANIAPPAASGKNGGQPATDPAQSNVHHMALSEMVAPEMVAGISGTIAADTTGDVANDSALPTKGTAARSASSEKKTSRTKKSRSKTNVADNDAVETPYSNHGLLSAIVTGFLTAEGVEDAPRITKNILAAYSEIIALLGDELSQADTGMMIAQIVSAIIRRHSISNRPSPSETESV
ncbi:hypothetical protein COO20_14280 [Thalassospira marina]|uniref:Uncharacterized protein n=2 Tax=Thalassospira marina TaxID=2048283 RepID=A0A2N3KRT3_9PROT|nr:hypothetical protein COO20_14280 [Thalassospira marina]